MSRCFTKIPICGLGEPHYLISIGLFYKNREVCGGLSDCEELVGVLTGDDECGVGSEERCCNCQ